MLLDLGIDGVGVRQQLRSALELATVPVVTVTHLRSRTRAALSAGVLQAPVESDVLLAAVNRPLRASVTGARAPAVAVAPRLRRSGQRQRDICRPHPDRIRGATSGRFRPRHGRNRPVPPPRHGPTASLSQAVPSPRSTLSTIRV